MTIYIYGDIYIWLHIYLCIGRAFKWLKYAISSLWPGLRWQHLLLCLLRNEYSGEYASYSTYRHKKGFLYILINCVSALSEAQGSFNTYFNCLLSSVDGNYISRRSFPQWDISYFILCFFSAFSYLLFWFIIISPMFSSLYVYKLLIKRTVPGQPRW